MIDEIREKSLSLKRASVAHQSFTTKTTQKTTSEILAWVIKYVNENLDAVCKELFQIDVNVMQYINQKNKQQDDMKNSLPIASSPGMKKNALTHDDGLGHDDDNNSSIHMKKRASDSFQVDVSKKQLFTVNEKKVEATFKPMDTSNEIDHANNRVSGSSLSERLDKMFIESTSFLNYNKNSHAGNARGRSARQSNDIYLIFVSFALFFFQICNK
jgi:hypothetical protein